jgi:predicted DNA-binding transcriptional regulator AlpA
MCKNVLRRAGRLVTHGRMTPKTLNLTDTAAYLGLSRRNFYNQLDDGRFPVSPIPGTHPRRWNVDDLDAWRAGSYEGEIK